MTEEKTKSAKDATPAPATAEKNYFTVVLKGNLSTTVVPNTLRYQMPPANNQDPIAVAVSAEDKDGTRTGFPASDITFAYVGKDATAAAKAAHATFLKNIWNLQV